jgi:hypothetical protein
MSILYRLAKPGGEYNRLYALSEREGFKKEPLGWPVVVAEENGKVIGFLATYPTDDALIAGPLVIEGGKRPFVFMRLVDAYENLMRMAGVSVYCFRVDRSNTKQIERVDSIGLERVGETDTHITYKRILES